ncbi:MAG: DUF2911 domain-containing protein [Bacteroidota bacterium]
MKNSLFVLLLSLFCLTFSCNNAADTSNNEETTATEEAPDETPAAEAEAVTAYTVPAKGANYNITVVDGEPKSPRKEMKGQIGEVAVTVNYGSPSKRGRDIWGTSLVPYGGKVWRTGANEATIIEFSQDVMIEGQKLPAGKYSLFSVNEAESTNLHFNSETGQWGSNHDASKDVLVVTVTPQTAAEVAESMDFMVDGDAVVLRWDTRAIPFKVAGA